MPVIGTAKSRYNFFNLITNLLCRKISVLRRAHPIVAAEDYDAIGDEKHGL